MSNRIQYINTSRICIIYNKNYVKISKNVVVKIHGSHLAQSHVVAYLDYITLIRASFKPIGPIAPNWAPPLRGPHTRVISADVD